ncbi:hypothetical protein [Halorarum salinum]|uniref:Uncharacterized protein n=1 Tax=Halorarum salinum TaxID=2743089 RepID=A0A7D5LAS0_9EURY|nr:hypothetical protein [Halobaculum salinum]QLG62050.1 hypothetical protein HUG12_10055 [Halobaculum salinum]
MRTLDAIKQARDAEDLTEVEGKPGLFVIEPLTTHRGEAYYLDLRDGFAFYGYDEADKPIRGSDREEPPTIVKEIRAHHMAEGTAKLARFVGKQGATDNQ